MCGHFLVKSKWPYNLASPQNYTKRSNIAPTEELPAVPCKSALPLAGEGFDCRAAALLFSLVVLDSSLLTLAGTSWGRFFSRRPYPLHALLSSLFFPVAEHSMSCAGFNLLRKTPLIQINKRIMGRVRSAAKGIKWENNTVAMIHRIEHSRQHAHIRFSTSYNECVDRAALQSILQNR